jgi:putative ABC transport system permease protein
VLSGFFGGLALSLAWIGLHGVASYNVTQRRKKLESAWRSELNRRTFCETLLREVTILIGIGLALGLAATVGATHLIASLLCTGSKQAIPGRFPAGAPMLVVVAGIAGFLPDRILSDESRREPWRPRNCH